MWPLSLTSCCAIGRGKMGWIEMRFTEIPILAVKIRGDRVNEGLTPAGS